MTAHGGHAAGLTESIQFIDEDNAWSLVLGLREKVSHSRCTDPDKHLYKIRAAHAEKGYPRFASNCFRKESLSCSRRTHQEDPPGNSSSQFLKSFGYLEEIDDFFQFLLGLIDARHIIKGYL